MTTYCSRGSKKNKRLNAGEQNIVKIINNNQRVSW
jgi:hypothetical protein